MNFIENKLLPHFDWLISHILYKDSLLFSILSSIFILRLVDKLYVAINCWIVVNKPKVLIDTRSYQGPSHVNNKIFKIIDFFIYKMFEKNNEVKVVCCDYSGRSG